jgi:glyoxylase-like metal-dependent hydrolase (beta-lactamase superfamily II)
MPTIIDIGGIRVTALNDGTIYLPPMYYPGLDFGAHPELLDPAGTYQIPAGCFLIQGDGFTILVDAGLGPPDMNVPFPDDVAAKAGLADPPRWIAEGGLLPGALAVTGVAPADVDAIFLTHLHPDHIGWVAPDGDLVFPNAEVVCGAADWEAPASPAPGEAERRAGLETANAAGALRPIDAASFEIAPGVAARHTPGHTPGHYIVTVSSNGEEVFLLGDAVHHPLQLTDKNISFLLETSPDHALRTREELFATLEGRDIAVSMAHIPGLQFQRIITRDGRRQWIAV